jgi:hypothetical protein
MKKRIAAVSAASALALAGFAGPAAAQPENEPPNCERGQQRAAENALEKGKLDQFAKHSAKGLACFFGEDPGQGGG